MIKYHGADENFSLEGKVAIITGAAAGIGKAIASFFAKKGAIVVGADLNPAVKQIMTEINPEFDGISGDITRDEQRKKVIDYTVSKHGRIDILVNCAGVVLLQPAEELYLDYWDKTMDINLKASFRMAQLAGQQMIKQNQGVIINMASQAGVIALDQHVAYCASKAAIISMTQVLAYEWGKYGIRVNAVSPTVVMTELGRKAWAGEKGELMKEQIPAQRFAEPDEIAATVAFLCSGGAAMITGANILIDGGYTAK